MKCPVVLGNHDFYVSRSEVSDDLNPFAQAGIRHSIRALSARDRDWLGNLPQTVVGAEFTLVHASLDHPLEWDYLFSAWDAQPTLALQTTPFCFYGHTHLPKLFIEPGARPAVLGENHFQFSRGQHCLINPGSVGQPRGEGDPRAQFAVFHPAELRVEFARVEYDVEGASQAILAAGLPDYLAERIKAGV
jgi:diadenosine tetraphosphatase ApaH/serine/threonine PP2A family protein phosphatase